MENIETAIANLNKAQQIPQSIEFTVQEDFINNLPAIVSNLEQVEQWAIAQTEQDRNLVLLTEEDFETAKERSAQLNKQIKLIEDKRKEIKKAYNQPYEVFEKASKRVTAVLSATRENLWSQVTKAEEEKKAIKTTKLRSLWESLNKESIGSYRTFEQIFNAKWLNKGVKIEQAFEEMQEIFKQQCTDVSAIVSLNSEFQVSLIEYYKDGHSISEVIAYNNRLNAQKQAEIERKQQIQANTQPNADNSKFAQSTDKERELESIVHIEFWVEGTQEKLSELGEYIREHGLKYGRIKN